MPFVLFPLAAAALGGMFIGSQVDNAVQASASKPAIIDQSKMPWWVQLLIIGGLILLFLPVLKKLIK